MRRVLLVDDEEMVLHALQRELVLDVGDGLVMQPESFTSPRQALARAAANEFDVVIADYRMPELNGADFVAELRKLQPHIAAIMLSGQTDRAGLIQAINSAHIDFFVGKPWDHYELRSILRQAIRQASLRRDNDRIAQAMRKHVDVAQLLKFSSRRRILVVDDEASVVKAVERELRDRSDDFEEIYLSLCLKMRLGAQADLSRLHYEITTATSPRQALELAAASPPDLLLTDFAMPEMNGIELGLRLRKSRPDLALIVFSGLAEMDTLGNSVNFAHADFFLGKPWARQQLKLFVAQSLVYHDMLRESRLLAEWLQRRKPEIKKLS